MSKAPAAAEPALTHVEISAGGLSVVIEADAPLSTVAKKALDVWRAADTTLAGRRGLRFGFEKPGEPATAAVPDLPPELTLPSRLTEGTDDEDRRNR